VAFTLKEYSTVIICNFRRKQVGALASAHWKNKIPKFNTPQMKAELSSFADEILSQCEMPEVGFSKEGIMEHIKSYFNEQRRYNRSKTKHVVKVSPSPFYLLLHSLFVHLSIIFAQNTFIFFLQSIMISLR